LRVIAADPDQINTTVLREKFLLHRLRPKPVVVIPQAISDREGTETLWVNSPGSTMNTLSRKWVEMLRHDDARFGATLAFRHTRTISTTTLEHLIQQYGLPYYIKIDVEGFEPAVLRGLQRPVPYVSFEVNLPEFRPEGLECLRLLAAISNSGVFNYSADVSRGLVLPEWLSCDQFAEVLSECVEPTIEVFWRN
jgi:FkbM family methyltransferase